MLQFKSYFKERLEHTVEYDEDINLTSNIVYKEVLRNL